MKSIDGSQLKKLNRIELLELLVEQGEQLEQTQEQLALVEARAAHQERIARLAEDAAARLSGILEAAQLAQAQYMQNLRELKAQMGVINETVSNDEASADDAMMGSFNGVANPAAMATQTVNAVSAAAFAANAASAAGASNIANTEGANVPTEEAAVPTEDDASEAPDPNYAYASANAASQPVQQGYEATNAYGYANQDAYPTATAQEEATGAPNAYGFASGNEALYNYIAGNTGANASAASVAPTWAYGSAQPYAYEEPSASVATSVAPVYTFSSYDLGGEPE